jgi:amino acid permease
LRMDLLVYVCVIVVCSNSSCAMGISTPLVAVASRMTFWVPQSHIGSAVWISVYLIFPIAFNFFNVRRYGEIEYWLTSLKTATCVGLIILGILLPLDVYAGPRKLGTLGNTHLIECINPITDRCVPNPGFNCTLIFWFD